MRWFGPYTGKEPESPNTLFGGGQNNCQCHFQVRDAVRSRLSSGLALNLGANEREGGTLWLSNQLGMQEEPTQINRDYQGLLGAITGLVVLLGWLSGPFGVAHF